MEKAAPDSPHTVLVVEDDSEIRESLLEILTDCGYYPVGAVNGLEGMKTLRMLSPRPCFILLDLMMPVMDGVSFREEQLEDPELADIPVVVISASRTVVETARALKIEDHLPKPLDLDQLLVIARRHCPGGTGHRGYLAG